MIVNFLCFFGPGAVTYVVRRHCLHQAEKEDTAVSAVSHIIAYSIFHMAVLTAFLQPPVNGWEVLWQGNLPVWQASPAYLVLSVVFAAACGCVPFGAQRHASSSYHENHMQKRRKYALYAVLLAASIGILAVPSAGKYTMQNMHVSTKPFKVNGAFYDAQLPVYTSEGEYFLSCQELAKGLGIEYGVKSAGLLQTEYYLGDVQFSVNRIAPGNSFFMKDGQVYVSLSYLKQGTPFSDIHVYDEPVLADGTIRQVVYIDNYPRRFDYSWTQNVYIAHALGIVDGVGYTNSREAFEQNYEAGHRVFEVDLQLTADQSLVAVHDPPYKKNGKLMSEKEFKRHKINGTYTALSIADIFRLMVQYPDFYLVTDTKETQSQTAAKQFQILVETANQIDPQVLTRIIPQIYNEEMFTAIMDIYEWKSMIYTMYALDNFSEQGVMDFAYKEGIQVITTAWGRAQSIFFQGLFERGIQVYMHTFNSLDEFKSLQQIGVHGIYTDFLTPQMGGLEQ